LLRLESFACPTPLAIGFSEKPPLPLPFTAGPLRSPTMKGKVPPARWKMRVGRLRPCSLHPRKDGRQSGREIIKRLPYGRFTQLDCAGSGSCHQPFGWRPSSGLYPLPTVAENVHPSGHPWAKTFSSRIGTGHTIGDRLSIPRTSATHELLGRRRVAGSYSPLCPLDFKARALQWSGQPKPLNGAPVPCARPGFTRAP
jgi:hypothetical protein